MSCEYRSYIRVGFLSLLFFILCCATVSAKRIADRSFFIYDTEKDGGIPDDVISDLELPYVGLSMRVEGSHQGVMLSGSSDSLALKKILITIKSTLQSNPNRIFPLFISFSGSARKLELLFESVGLDKMAYIHPSGEVWPDEEDIIASNKRLLIFSFERSSVKRSYLHYAWDYIADLQWMGGELSNFDGLYAHGDISNELLIVRNFITPYFNSSNEAKSVLDVNTDPFYLNYLLDAWRVTGKVPNFIFTETKPRNIGTLYFALVSHIPFRGEIIDKGAPIRRVKWKGDIKSLTNGYFCFPYSIGDELSINPYCEGYKLSEEQITIDSEEWGRSETVINAVPHLLDDNLSGYFLFNDDISNSVANSTIKDNSIMFKSDQSRGAVLKIAAGGDLNLGPCTDYNITNRSFSVSMWVKLDEILPGRDYPLVGTTDSRYRHGLHLMVRDRRPYFGFHSNDLHTNYILEAGRWYNIVFRYNVKDGEQSIFINGEVVGESPNHASFLGGSDLFIGRSLGQKLHTPIYIDDVGFWGRALGDEEIYTLYRGVSPILSNENFGRFTIGEVLLLLLLFVLSFAVPYVGVSHIMNRRRGVADSKFDSDLTSRLEVIRDGDVVKYGQIDLFGRFMIFNLDGDRVTKLFSLTLRKVLILLLINSEMDENGIDVVKFSEIIWPDSDIKRVANSRNVAINKLRHLLEDIGAGSIVNEKGWLRIEWNREYSNQFSEYLKFIKNRSHSSNIEDIINFLEIIGKGSLLSKSEWEWLDSTKSNVSTTIIALLSKYLREIESSAIGSDVLTIKIVDRLLIEDDMNELAIQHKLKVLQRRGDHSLVHITFNQFRVRYEGVYGEPFNITLAQFLSRELNF